MQRAVTATALLFYPARRRMPRTCRAERFRDDVAERREVLASRRSAPPCEADGARGLRFGKAQQPNAVIAHLDFSGYLRQQRYAIAVRYHLHHGGERSCPQTGRHIATRSRAKCQRLIAQAVPLLQQNQSALVDIGNTNTTAQRTLVGSRHRQQEWVVEQPQCFDVDAFHRKRQHHAIEFAAHQFLEQHLSLRLTHFQPQPRIFGLQLRQYTRQDVRSERRDDAKLEDSAQHIAVAREINKVSGGGKDAFGALRHFHASGSECDLVWPPLDQFGADLTLELTHLHREGRLAD